MCGIAGFVGFEDRKTLREMCDAIKHRGPDESGYHIDRNVCLGNRRLSIIDLKGGKQPIYNENKSVVIVFNGEIYNFKEIKDELEKKGHRFSTNSDTEVLVHGYEEYGYDILQKVNGMFAFAIWDSGKKELFIARDRLGIKPLYYYWNNDKIIFSSEIKSIMKSGEIKPELSRRALYRYMSMRYVPGDITILDGIRKLMPGHYMTFRSSVLQISKYWDVPFGKEFRTMEESKKKITELLEDSVRLRLISDVPIGAFLSGGIDSSIIVALMSKFSDRVKTFSVGFVPDSCSEIEHARIVADRLGTDHHEIIVDSEKFIKALPKIIYHLDEPIADPAAIPTYFVSELARKSVKVVLSGEGGDELFAGYPKYGMQKREILTKYYIKTPKIVRAAIKRSVPGKYGIKADSLETAERFFISPFIRNAKILEKQFNSDISGDIKSIFKPYLGIRDPMKEMQYVDIKTWLPEELLMKVDKMSMANSLEARVPFLDHRLVECSMLIPSRYNIRNGVEKFMLRESFSDIIPESTSKRKKHPFSVPLNEWKREIIDHYSNYLGETSRLPMNKYDLVVLKIWLRENGISDQIDIAK